MKLRPRILLLFILSMAVWSGGAESQAPLKPPGAPSPAPGATSSAPASAIPNPGEIFRDCPDCSEMVVVPAGEFRMGSGETMYEKPEHRLVIANPFAIGRREITFEEQELCFCARGCKN